MKKTIKELSEITGFSPSTISRVMTKNKNVNPETRQRVEESLRRLDCEAPRTRKKKLSKKTILVITGETSSAFSVKLFHVMSDMLREQGYVVLIGNSGFAENLEEQYVEYAQAQQFCGIVMITPMETEPLRRLIANSPCPIVLVNRYLRSIDLDAVYMDNYRAGYMIANHLRERGHRRIVCLSGGQKSTASVDRIAGFLAAFADAGVSTDGLLVREGDLRQESGSAFGSEYLASHRECTAVFSVNEPMARGFIETITEAGLKIPDDVSVICVAPVSVNLSNGVKLTCVIHNAELLGTTAVEMLLDRLDGLNASPRKIVYPPQLCVHDSVKQL